MNLPTLCATTSVNFDERASAQVEEAVDRILDELKQEGEGALARLTVQFDGRQPEAPLFYDRAILQRALAEIGEPERNALERIAARIGRFADQQLDSLRPLELRSGGIKTGHDWVPVRSAGCYAPGGRFPLPSSVLMTVMPAKSAGVAEVWVACPRPTRWVLAAAALAGACGLLHAGGAQAIGALAYGCGPVPACDVVVGPGNDFVNVAKQRVSERCGVDLVAGPSEVVVIADASACVRQVAADLIAQAEHGPDSRVFLICTESGVAKRVDDELEAQLSTHPDPATVRSAFARGGQLEVGSVELALEWSDRIAPEHLLLAVEEGARYRTRVRNAGSIVLGAGASVVLGDYGAGPNHVLPTGGAARYSAGLSVFKFGRIRSYIEVEEEAELASLRADSALLARVEGLEGHARAVEVTSPPQRRASTESNLTQS